MAVVTAEFQELMKFNPTQIEKLRLATKLPDLKAQTISLLSPKIAGTITSVIVDIGDKVKSGEAVIKLDNASFKLWIHHCRNSHNRPRWSFGSMLNVAHSAPPYILREIAFSSSTCPCIHR